MKIFEPAGIPPAFSLHSRASTATYVDDAGLLQTAAANVLRYQGGLPLVEDAGANLIANSQNFGAWAAGGISNMTVVTGVADPFGGTNAARLTSTSTSSLFQQAVVVTAGVTLTGSFWIRRHTGSGAVNLRVGDGNAYPVPVTSTWQRLAITAVATTTTGRIGVVLSVSGDAVEIFGAQLEVGAAMTSYMPTPAAGTRAADVFAPSATDLIGGTGPAGGVFFTSAFSYYGAWFAAEHSPGGKRVVYEGTLWELAADQSPAAVGDVPGVSPKWLRVGPENRIAAFDGEINSRTYSHPLPNLRTNSVSFIFSLGAAADALLLSDIDDAATVRVRIAASLTGATLVDQTISPDAGASRVRSQYLVSGFTASATAVAFITISGPVNVATPGIGLIAWGTTEEFGGTMYGVRAGQVDYSRKEPDAFGQVVFVRRSFSKTVDASVVVGKDDLNRVQDRLNGLRATPVVWIFSDDPAHAVPLVVYGFYGDFYTVLDRPLNSVCTLQVKGLT